MDATELQNGVTASQTLIDALEDKDRVAIRDIAAARPSLPFTLLDRAARATAKSTLTPYATANDSGSPMDAALQWAIGQFDQPGIANDGRPHYVVAFTDGEWSLTQATTQTLQTRGINVFGVTTPRAGSGPAAVLQLVQATNGPRADLRFFNRTDVAASYRDFARTLRSTIGQISAGSLAPGMTQDSTYPADRGAQHAHHHAAPARPAGAGADRPRRWRAADRHDLHLGRPGQQPGLHPDRDLARRRAGRRPRGRRRGRLRFALQPAAPRRLR
jgi:hypothetical protein